ncbi:class I SAM-dependent methyltransferase [Pseudonocardia nematodicida]|uniref:Class I SAM-dependent methyltransferase n=1 Tax=Pseudonocardia nematodicida TaxID=1206997 RepID=A0ABV1KAM7_9PSEU
MNADAWQSDEIRPPTVHRAYGRGASGYDAFVGSIPGYRTHLRVSASRMGLGDGPGLRLLDIGCGTGISTEALLTSVKGAEVVAVDASTEMLAVARRKNWSPRVTFVHSRLETLAEAGVQGPFDGILASYLVSNLPDAEHGLRLLLSLLAPGAPLAVHDYAVGGARGRMRWATAAWTYLVPMAAMRWGVADLARYRTKRIGAAGGPSVMTHKMERAGFDDVRVQTVGGLEQHLVHTFLGRRPDEPDVVGERRQARAAASVLAAAGFRPRSEPAPAAGEPPEEAPAEDGPAAVDDGGPQDPGYADELPDDLDEDGRPAAGGEDEGAEDDDTRAGTGGEDDVDDGDLGGGDDSGDPADGDDGGRRAGGGGARPGNGRRRLGIRRPRPAHPEEEPPTPPTGTPRV